MASFPRVVSTTLSLTALALIPAAAATASAALQDDPYADASSSGAEAPARAEPAAPAGRQTEIEQLRAEVAELKARMDAAEEAALAEAGGGEFEPTFDVYGYLTLELQKWITDDDNAFNGIVDTNLSFGMQNLNVYFSSHMTETLSALVEIGFTSMPHGLEKSWIPYERYDNRVQDPRNTETNTLAGVMIERAQMAWQPYDFFGVTAGRFFTPYGIWNIDHSPVVIIPVNIPYLMIRQTIPPAQTGLAVQGRFFPGDHAYLDYAVTLSNGRGPTEELFDLDDNKAAGLRLKWSYEKDRFGISLGGYGFYGTMTDSIKELNPDPENFDINIVTVEKYRELAGSADLQLRLWGVLLQAEWAGGYIRYVERPPKIYPIVNVVIPGEYQPDYLRWDAYALLAWTLPLDKWLGEKKLTLYTMGERSIMDDSDDDYNVWMLRWGIDFKPVSCVVLKVDTALLMMPDSELISENAWSVGGQIAVAF
jgi:hypothetical protein